jgi:hypothetical protein
MHQEDEDDFLVQLNAKSELMTFGALHIRVLIVSANRLEQAMDVLL